jgi:transcriptional regulator with XRE-family HTH domain
LSVHRAFGQVLREYRKKANLSQEELAHRSGIDRTFVSLLERGLRQPSLSTILELSKVLGVAPSSLVNEVEKRTRRPRTEAKRGGE